MMALPDLGYDLDISLFQPGSSSGSDGDDDMTEALVVPPPPVHDNRRPRKTGGGGGGGGGKGGVGGRIRQMSRKYDNSMQARIKAQAVAFQAIEAAKQVQAREMLDVEADNATAVHAANHLATTVRADATTADGEYHAWVLLLGTKQRNLLIQQMQLSEPEKLALVMATRKYKQLISSRKYAAITKAASASTKGGV